jgi:hypothetical protein
MLLRSKNYSRARGSRLGRPWVFRTPRPEWPCTGRTHSCLILDPFQLANARSIVLTPALFMVVDRYMPHAGEDHVGRTSHLHRAPEPPAWAPKSAKAIHACRNQGRSPDFEFGSHQRSSFCISSASGFMSTSSPSWSIDRFHRSIAAR